MKCLGGKIWGFGENWEIIKKKRRRILLRSCVCMTDGIKYGMLRMLKVAWKG